jgi:NAD-dependent SIR2 family protein deacetylase
MVTQNIDNFHVEAQEISKKKNKNFKNYPIYEIHGNILKVRCDKCTEKGKQLYYQPYEKYISIFDDGKDVLCNKC